MSQPIQARGAVLATRCLRAGLAHRVLQASHAGQHFPLVFFRQLAAAGGFVAKALQHRVEIRGQFAQFIAGADGHTAGVAAAGIPGIQARKPPPEPAPHRGGAVSSGLTSQGSRRDQVFRQGAPPHRLRVWPPPTANHSITPGTG